MKYTYAYKTSDGVRHEAAMEAASRETVFAALRQQGIKAIKVVAADGSKANGEVRGVRKRVVATVAIGVAVVAGVLAFGLGRARTPSAPLSESIGSVVVITNVAAGSAPSLPMRVAASLPRQQILGDRQRLAKAVASITNAAERALAAFAEPGRPLPKGLAADNANSTTIPISVLIKSENYDAAFRTAMENPLLISPDELTESIDLKRIVTGLKAEMRRYVAGGGTVGGYLDECVKRQRQEIAFRARAEERLTKMLNETNDNRADAIANRKIEKSKNSPASAYAYWLNANAQLQSMGIYPLPLPDQLREYQHSLDFDE